MAFRRTPPKILWISAALRIQTRERSFDKGSSTLMSRTTAPFSDSACCSAKPIDRAYMFFGGDGLSLLVQPNGRKPSRLRYAKPDENEGLVSFGNYPVVCLDTYDLMQYLARGRLLLRFFTYLRTACLPLERVQPVARNLRNPGHTASAGGNRPLAYSSSCPPACALYACFS